MCPAIGKPNVRPNALWRDQPVVSCITVDLKDAREAVQYPFGINALTTGRIGEGDTRRSAAAPRAIISRQRSEVSGLGFARAGIEKRDGSRP